jgi:hypothetical protein
MQALETDIFRQHKAPKQKHYINYNTLSLLLFENSEVQGIQRVRIAISLLSGQYIVRALKSMRLDYII